MATTTLITSEQYLAMPDEFDQNGNRIKDELIGGEIVRMPFPSQLHDLLKNRINELLIAYLQSRADLGFRSLVEFGTGVSDLDVFAPDVCVIRRDRLNKEGRIFEGSPDIAIEIVLPSDTAKHLKRKLDAYLKSGSKSIWVVYPEANSIELHSPNGPTLEFKAGQTIEDPSLPGFSQPVASFFEIS